MIIGLLAGVAFDIVVWGMRGRKSSFYIGFFVYTLVMMALFVGALVYLDLPGFDASITAVIAITVVFIVEGFVSVFGALKLEARLRRLAPDFSVVPQ